MTGKEFSEAAIGPLLLVTLGLAAGAGFYVFSLRLFEWLT